MIRRNFLALVAKIAGIFTVGKLTACQSAPNKFVNPDGTPTNEGFADYVKFILKRMNAEAQVRALGPTRFANVCVIPGTHVIVIFVDRSMWTGEYPDISDEQHWNNHVVIAHRELEQPTSAVIVKQRFEAALAGMERIEFKEADPLAGLFTPVEELS